MSSDTSRTQKHRHMAISTPLGEDKVLLVSMHGSEALGRLFEFELDLASESEPIKPADLLGKSVTVTLEMLDKDATPRYFNGIINRISLTGVDETKDSRAVFTYRATMVPKLWLLTRHADCRIFQTKKVPDIIQQIFRERGCTDIEAQLTRTYREWEYCVQYRETDFNFVSRLMENEGIYYYFKHEDGKHTIVLCDAPSCHSAVSNYDKLEFGEPDPESGKDVYIWDWNERIEITSTQYVLTDYNFETPSTDLKQITSVTHSHDSGPYEIFDYPGGYTKSGEGKGYVGARVQEVEAQYIVARGTSSARPIHAGALFKITEHPVTSDSDDYLITAISYQLHNDDMGLGLGGGGDVFTCQITAIPNKYDYRSPRITPKPIVQGPQTALVVGKSGEEIWTDKYGRIKVQFYWDRVGNKDENSSCWVRVVQPWGGKNWGAHFIPRMGMEVVITFLEGDPDRPLCTGCVYNATNMYPFTLPDNKNQSGIKTRSTKNGTPDNYNEISFDDTKGTEKITIHGQFDMSTTIEHDQTLLVKNNRSGTVNVDDTETVKGKQTVDVTGDQSVTLHANQMQKITGNQNEDITGNQDLKVTGSQTYNITGKQSHTVTGSHTLSATGASSITSKASIDLGAPTIKVTGQASIILTAGGSSIQIDASGVKITTGAIVSIMGAMIKNNA